MLTALLDLHSIPQQVWLTSRTVPRLTGCQIARRIWRVVAVNWLSRWALVACRFCAHALRTASLTEAALAFGIGSIARSVRAGCGYNQID